MATYTETTTNYAVLDDEIFAGIVTTTLEEAVVSSEIFFTGVVTCTDTAELGDSSEAGPSKTVLETAVIRSTVSSKKHFVLTTTETARLSSSSTHENIAPASEITEVGVVTSSFGPYAPLRSTINETGSLSSATSTRRKHSSTTLEVAAVSSSLVLTVKQTSSDGAVITSSITTVGRAHGACTETAAMSSSSTHRVVHRPRLLASAVAVSTVSGRRRTRHTLTDKLYGGSDAVTFRA